MEDWNVVVTVREGGYKRVFRLLGEFGRINRTGFFNVLTMRANNIADMLDALREEASNDPEVSSLLARVIPVTHTFNFQNPEEFEDEARKIVLSWAPELAAKKFHVRMHRRGFKGRLSSWEMERVLDEAILEYLEKAGTPARISFSDPDAVVAVETLGQWAGLSLWMREDIERNPFLRFETSSKQPTDTAG